MTTHRPNWIMQGWLLLLMGLAPVGCGMFQRDPDDGNSSDEQIASPEGTDAADAPDAPERDDEADRLAEEARDYANRIEGADAQGTKPRANALDIMPGELTSSDRALPAGANQTDDTGNVTSSQSDQPAETDGESQHNTIEPDADQSDTTGQPRALSRAELLIRLRAELSAGGGDDLQSWLQRAALAALDPQRTITAEQVQHLSSDQREVVLGYQRLARRIAELPHGEADEQRAKLQTAVDELHETLAGQRSFEIAALELCRKVNGYGVYDPFEQTTFLVGRKHPVIVYAELANFQTEREGDEYVVRLSQELVLYNESDGLPVWRQQPEQIIDRSRNRRRDFFVVQLIHLSERLSVGKYHLKVRITDRTAQQVDERSIPITIVADPELVRQP